MNSYECEIGYVEKNDIILITKNNVSYDNGKTWNNDTSICQIQPAECFNGTKTENGPSMSGFWGNSNEIRSGLSESYCSKFDGKRWRSLRQK